MWLVVHTFESVVGFHVFCTYADANGSLGYNERVGVWRRLRTGYVTRLVLEEGLRQHCRQALHSLPAPHLLDLMNAHAAGQPVIQPALSRPLPNTCQRQGLL